MTENKLLWTLLRLRLFSLSSLHFSCFVHILGGYYEGNKEEKHKCSKQLMTAVVHKQLVK